MKLSDIKGERTFEVIAAIVEPVANIAEDGDVAAALKARTKGEPAKQFAAKMRSALPLIVGKHRDDVVAILSAINGVKPEEYMEGCTLSSLIGDVYEILTDGEFLAFLSSQPTGDGSGTSSESTEG